LRSLSFLNKFTIKRERRSRRKVVPHTSFCV
jgi:hypothetical protein